jgi:hypothetical protein
MTIESFDLATFRQRLGAQDFAAVLRHDNEACCTHYVSIQLEWNDDRSEATISADYVMSFSGRNKQRFNLITFTLSVDDGVWVIRQSRNLGELIIPDEYVDAVMQLVSIVSHAKFPDDTMLNRFLPEQYLEVIANPKCHDTTHSADILLHDSHPAHRNESLPVLYDGFVNPDALAMQLNLSANEKAEFVDVDIATGDYRVFHISRRSRQDGSETLLFELHRQAPGLEHRIFKLLTLELGSVNSQGLRPIHAFRSHMSDNPAVLPGLLPELATIIRYVQQKKRPSDAWLLPFFSISAHILWSKPLGRRSAV